MFSAEDAKEVFQLLSLEGDLSNPLILSSRGDGFVTRKHTRRAFEDLVTEDAFARKHGLSHSSLDILIDLSELHIVEVNGYLYSTAYDMTASGAIANLLRENLQKLQAADLKSTDVPGNPPTWFIHRTVNSLLKEPDFAGKLHVHGLPSRVRCTPVQLIKQTHDTVINNLQSGKTAYIDLQIFQRDNEAIYSSIEEAQAALESTKGIEIVETFAISEAWISKSSMECSSGMARDGGVEIRVSASELRANHFPGSILATVIDKVEHAIRAISPKIHRVGDCILSEYGYDQDRNILFDLAKADAASQWQQLKEVPKADVKYSLSSIIDQIPNRGLVLRDLVKERTIQRALDDAFSIKISELEKQNEAEFADYWTDRVVTRVAIYSQGLTAIEDQKLRDQLSELFAQYLQKGLMPDTISKVTSQGLVLSRKTRKNIQKLESALSAGNMDVSALTTSLDKFNKKQSIDAPVASALGSSKAAMLGDMARRMQKQKSDGPLLFLTLVVFLFAKHNAGVVYATGKFAPKLLKQLRAILDAEQYARLEAWKEAARAGTLSAEDRDGMKKMVEAGV
ncbi:hypothetical protein BU25DRAFT_396179 [Macroventuria anomochaeta]|uniref:Uncharacterized protein n=1 Tax=Macroventuria anomochaeta TaxID=301207 RepID=A0ACB6RYJ4_9PLEO|nr:uncharacterized protein BU25DRAFT_396179 [Macroventuria anomochaeta]KAF2626004.1 hypothetical protein BU25DRAFT_396179 [Macroventuria anomochaeta]